MGSTTTTTTTTRSSVAATFVILYLLLLIFSCVVNMSASSAIPNGQNVESELSSWWRGIPEEEYIAKLNSANINSYVVESGCNNNNSSFVMFYRDWCEFSQRAREGFAGAAQPLSKRGITPGALDCDEAETICQKYQVKTVPTFLYIRNGSVVGRHANEFERTKDKFVEWALPSQEKNKGNDQSHSSNDPAPTTSASAAAAGTGSVPLVFVYPNYIFY